MHYLRTARKDEVALPDARQTSRQALKENLSRGDEKESERIFRCVLDFPIESDSLLPSQLIPTNQKQNQR